jgi:hypothetical protein
VVKHAGRETSRVVEVEAVAVDLVLQRISGHDPKRGVNPAASGATNV